MDTVFRTVTPALKDRPSIAGGRLVYVSTQEPSGRSQDSWNAVYSIDLKTGITGRITPPGVADFSPAISPSGQLLVTSFALPSFSGNLEDDKKLCKLVMVASTEGKGWHGEIEALCLDLYVLSAVDGSGQCLVAKDGGWPCWADELTVFFHHQADDGWWSIFQITLSEQGASEPERITPWCTCLHSSSIAKRCRENLNPTKVNGYNHVKETAPSVNTLIPYLEPVLSPLPQVSLIRIDGAFPAFSRDGSMIVFIKAVFQPGLWVVNLNGTGIQKVFEQDVFACNWDPIRKGTVYVSLWPSFVAEDKTVHILAIHDVDTIDLKPGEKNLAVTLLTKPGTKNNAFPAISPDGKYIVFRSGRSGHKNLWIMDAEEGEEKYLQRLTEGEWTDTMPNWSPDNEWIAFSSDREQQGEPISVPNQFQPYGDLFLSKADGTEVQRLTHNAYENGTPAWGCTFIPPHDLSGEGKKLSSQFDDSHFLKTEPKLVTPKRVCGQV
ncbi:unnamed protein product [Sphagnum balticum]